MRDLESVDLIVTRERSDCAINFNVADWTNVSSLPGHTNFSGHTRTIIQESPIVSASAQFALQTMGAQARVAALQYDAAGSQVWSYFPAVVQAGPNNIQLINVDCTAALDAAFAHAPYVYAMAQVRGAGALYLARFHVTWSKPDVVDYGPTIANHETRIQAVEGSIATGGGSSAGYDDTALVQRISAIESRFAAIKAAL
jgi:hypothetical protein